jgi:hypothetical protein
MNPSPSNAKIVQVISSATTLIAFLVLIRTIAIGRTPVFVTMAGVGFVLFLGLNILVWRSQHHSDAAS